jgi:hypothetical protein
MIHSPSPEVLDQHLPRIRQVIVNLLHGLKAKQALLKKANQKRRNEPPGLPMHAVQPAVKNVAPPQQNFDKNDSSTALTILTRQDNLARRSSVRHKSLMRAKRDQERVTLKNGTDFGSDSSLNTLTDESKRKLRNRVRIFFMLMLNSDDTISANR